MQTRYIRKKYTFKSRLLFTLLGGGCVPCKTHTCPINAYSRFNKTTILRGKKHSHNFPERCEEALRVPRACYVRGGHDAEGAMHLPGEYQYAPIHRVPLTHAHRTLIHAPLSHERRLAAPIFELSYNVP